jgi:hypothetical protein
MIKSFKDLEVWQKAFQLKRPLDSLINVTHMINLKSDGLTVFPIGTEWNRSTEYRKRERKREIIKLQFPITKQ